MIAWLTKLLPRSVIVYLYRKLPLPNSVKKMIVARANTRFLVAVLGIIQNEKGEILLLHHTYRNDEPWGIPGGWMEPEDPAQALVREVYEETNLVIEVERLIRATFSASPHRIDLYFQGRVVGGTFRACEEVSDYGFFPIGEWPQGMPRRQQRLLEQELLVELTKG